MKKFDFKFSCKKSRMINNYIGIRNNCSMFFLFLIIIYLFLFILNLWLDVSKLWIDSPLVLFLISVIINLCFLFCKKGVYLYKNSIKIVTLCYTGSWYFHQGVPHKLIREIYINDIETVELCKPGIDQVNRDELLMYIDQQSDFITITLINKNKYTFSLENNEDFINEIMEIKGKS